MLGCPCSLSERAALAVLNADETDLPRFRDVFRERRDALFPLLSSIPGIRVDQSAGAFYFWLDVRGLGIDDAAFCRMLLEEEGVALTPGSAFLCPGYVRLAYTQPEPALKKASERIRRFAVRIRNV